jgi:hypothetical protein
VAVRLLIAAMVPLGVGLGWLWPRSVRPEVAVPQTVCVQAASVAVDCDRVDLATRWCEARLASLDAPSRLTLAHPPVPSDHATAVVDALAACGVPTEPVEVDCAELPCVVSARLGADEEEVTRAIAACPELAALGFASAPVQAWPVQCPDGTASTMGLIVAGDEIDAIATAMVPELADDEGFAGAIIGGYFVAGQVGRRAEQLARRWPCP